MVQNLKRFPRFPKGWLSACSGACSPRSKEAEARRNGVEALNVAKMLAAEAGLELEDIMSVNGNELGQLIFLVKIIFFY